ncbi:MAG: GNAT family N-acetyltransferase [Erysipelotrichaceae bacterium]|nr:GNAT family N-acetyltransferase [Erysipelotrichaceae bacterium]
MDDFVNEKDHALLDNDRYTFFVLKKIMDKGCRLLLSDHEKLIICFTCPPYPVWIWTADDASADDLERAYQTVKEYFLLDGSNSFNLKYEAAEYFLSRNKELGLITNMFAYDCPEAIEPAEKADGHLHQCTAEDLDELTAFLDLFHEEIGIDKKDLEGYRKDAADHIASGTMYFWKDEKGKSVACCKFGPSGDMAAINVVFTRPECRRKHYAQNLVYEVTMKAKEAGYLPMLYTDADYTASNTCYEKIGYVLRGKLCTIGYR